MHTFIQKCLDWLPQSPTRLQKKITLALEENRSQQAYFLIERYLHQSSHTPDEILFLLMSIDRFYDQFFESKEARFLTVSVLQFVMKFNIQKLTEPFKLAFFRIHVFTYHIMCDFFLQKKDMKNLTHFYGEYEDCLRHYQSLLPREHIVFDVYFKLLALQYLDARREENNLTDDEFYWEGVFLDGLGEAIESLYMANRLKPLTYMDEFDSLQNMDFLVYIWLCHGRDGLIRQDSSASESFHVADTLAQKVQYIAEQEGNVLNGESRWTHLAVQYYKNGILPESTQLAEAWHRMEEEEQVCAKLTLTNQPLSNDALLEWINVKN